MDFESEKKTFPWIKKVRKKFLKSFPEITEETLTLLKESIHCEFLQLDWNDKLRIESFYSTLSYFYLHFIIKMNLKEEPVLKFVCVQLLYYLTYTGLILSDGKTESQWLSRVLSALKSYTGHCEIFDVLLLVRNVSKKYLSAYKEILRCILLDPSIQYPSDAENLMKIMLLFKRLKSLLKIDGEAIDDSYLTTKVECPPNLEKFISTLHIFDLTRINKKNFIQKFLKKKLSPDVLQNLFLALFKNKYDDRIICSNFKNNTKNKSSTTLPKRKVKLNHKNKINNNKISFGEPCHKFKKIKALKSKLKEKVTDTESILEQPIDTFHKSLCKQSSSKTLKESSINSEIYSEKSFPNPDNSYPQTNKSRTKRLSQNFDFQIKTDIPSISQNISEKSHLGDTDVSVVQLKDKKKKVMSKFKKNASISKNISEQYSVDSVNKSGCNQSVSQPFDCSGKKSKSKAKYLENSDSMIKADVSSNFQNILGSSHLEKPSIQVLQHKKKKKKLQSQPDENDFEQHLLHAYSKSEHNQSVNETYQESCIDSAIHLEETFKCFDPLSGKESKYKAKHFDSNIETGVPSTSKNIFDKSHLDKSSSQILHSKKKKKKKSHLKENVTVCEQHTVDPFSRSESNQSLIETFEQSCVNSEIKSEDNSINSDLSCERKSNSEKNSPENIDSFIKIDKPSVSENDFEKADLEKSGSDQNNYFSEKSLKTFNSKIYKQCNNTSIISLDEVQNSHDITEGFIFKNSISSPESLELCSPSPLLSSLEKNEIKTCKSIYTSDSSLTVLSEDQDNAVHDESVIHSKTIVSSDLPSKSQSVAKYTTKDENFSFSSSPAANDSSNITKKLNLHLNGKLDLSDDENIDVSIKLSDVNSKGITEDGFDSSISVCALLNGELTNSKPKMCKKGLENRRKSKKLLSSSDSSSDNDIVLSQSKTTNSNLPIKSFNSSMSASEIFIPSGSSNEVNKKETYSWETKKFKSSDDSLYEPTTAKAKIKSSSCRKRRKSKKLISTSDSSSDSDIVLSQLKIMNVNKLNKTECSSLKAAKLKSSCLSDDDSVSELKILKSNMSINLNSKLNTSEIVGHSVSSSKLNEKESSSLRKEKSKSSCDSSGEDIVMSDFKIMKSNISVNSCNLNTSTSDNFSQNDKWDNNEKICEIKSFKGSLIESKLSDKETTPLIEGNINLSEKGSDQAIALDSRGFSNSSCFTLQNAVNDEVEDIISNSFNLVDKENIENLNTSSIFHSLSDSSETDSVIPGKTSNDEICFDISSRLSNKNSDDKLKTKSTALSNNMKELKIILYDCLTHKNSSTKLSQEQCQRNPNNIYKCKESTETQTKAFETSTYFSDKIFLSDPNLTTKENSLSPPKLKNISINLEPIICDSQILHDDESEKQVPNSSLNTDCFIKNSIVLSENLQLPLGKSISLSSASPLKQTLLGDAGNNSLPEPNDLKSGEICFNSYKAITFDSLSRQSVKESNLNNPGKISRKSEDCSDISYKSDQSGSTVQSPECSSTNFAFSSKNVTPDSDSSSGKKLLRKDIHLTGNAKSLVLFSASEDDSNNNGASSDYASDTSDSDLDGFIVSDNYESFDEDPISNSNQTHLISDSSKCESDKISLKSNIKRKVYNKPKSRKMSTTESDLSDDEISNTKGLKILSDSEKKDSCYETVSSNSQLSNGNNCSKFSCNNISPSNFHLKGHQHGYKNISIDQTSFASGECDQIFTQQNISGDKASTLPKNLLPWEEVEPNEQSESKNVSEVSSDTIFPDNEHLMLGVSDINALHPSNSISPKSNPQKPSKLKNGAFCIQDGTKNCEKEGSSASKNSFNDVIHTENSEELQALQSNSSNSKNLQTNMSTKIIPNNSLINLSISHKTKKQPDLEKSSTYFEVNGINIDSHSISENEKQIKEKLLGTSSDLFSNLSQKTKLTETQNGVINSDCQGNTDKEISHINFDLDDLSKRNVGGISAQSNSKDPALSKIKSFLECEKFSKSQINADANILTDKRNLQTLTIDFNEGDNFSNHNVGSKSLSKDNIDNAKHVLAEDEKTEGNLPKKFKSTSRNPSDTDDSNKFVNSFIFELSEKALLDNIFNSLSDSFCKHSCTSIEPTVFDRSFNPDLFQTPIDNLLNTSNETHPSFQDNTNFDVVDPKLSKFTQKESYQVSPEYLNQKSIENSNNSIPIEGIHSKRTLETINNISTAELNNFDENIIHCMVNNSTTKLDQQLNEMGFEMLSECDNVSTVKGSQTEVLNFKDNSGEKGYAKMVLGKENLIKELVTTSKADKRILFLYDEEKQSCEVCKIPDAALLEILEKSGSQTLNTVYNPHKFSNGEKLKNDLNENDSSRYLFLDGVKYYTASLLPVVNLGTRCDDIQINQNRLQTKLKVSPYKIPEGVTCRRIKKQKNSTPHQKTEKSSRTIAVKNGNISRFKNDQLRSPEMTSTQNQTSSGYNLRPRNRIR